MLFDLRGRGRRRTVQVIYIGLAIIFLLGFVGLGVGGGFGSGGIFSAFTGSEGSGGASFSAQIAKYKKLAQRQPNNIAAWEQLINAQLHEAGGEAYTSRTGGATAKGKELYAQIAQSWNHYIALNPPKPNPELAQRMVTVFGFEGLNDPASAVSVLQIVVANRPTSAALYASLAEYAYLAHNPRVGDLAAAKAVKLAPATQRKRLQTELAALKKHPSGTESSSAATNGTAFTVNPSTTPAPAGSGSTK